MSFTRKMRSSEAKKPYNAPPRVGKTDSFRPPQPPFLIPQAARTVFARFFARKPPVLRHKPSETSAFHAEFSPPAQAQDRKCRPPVKHSNFSKKTCVTSGAEKFGRKTANFSIKIFRSKPEISRQRPILLRFRSEKPH